MRDHPLFHYVAITLLVLALHVVGYICARRKLTAAERSHVAKALEWHFLVIVALCNAALALPKNWMPVACLAATVLLYPVFRYLKRGPRSLTARPEE